MSDQYSLRYLYNKIVLKNYKKTEFKKYNFLAPSICGLRNPVGSSRSIRDVSSNSENIQKNLNFEMDDNNDLLEYISKYLGNRSPKPFNSK